MGCEWLPRGACLPGDQLAPNRFVRFDILWNARVVTRGGRGPYFPSAVAVDDTRSWQRFVSQAKRPVSA